MPYSLADKLVVAISSRALFDLEEENQVFEQQQAEAYQQLQLQRLEIPARAGAAWEQKEAQASPPGGGNMDHRPIAPKISTHFLTVKRGPKPPQYVCSLFANQEAFYTHLLCVDQLYGIAS